MNYIRSIKKDIKHIISSIENLAKIIRRNTNMKFVKGMLIGGMATMGMIMMYNEMSNKSKKQIMKKGKDFVKRMGIM